MPFTHPSEQEKCPECVASDDHILSAVVVMSQDKATVGFSSQFAIILRRWKTLPGDGQVIKALEGTAHANVASADLVCRRA